MPVKGSFLLSNNLTDTETDKKSSEVFSVQTGTKARASYKDFISGFIGYQFECKNNSLPTVLELVYKLNK